LNLRFSILLIFIINAFIFTGCGYKPTSYYAKSAINGKVYVDIDMNVDNSSNSVIIKDIMNEMVLNQFEAQLTHNKDIADTHINVKLLDIEQKAISSDNQGYVSLYRTTVYIKIRYKKRDEKAVELKVSNFYDYSVDDDSIITEQKKQDSIKLAVSKALSDVFSKIAVSNFK